MLCWILFINPVVTSKANLVLATTMLSLKPTVSDTLFKHFRALYFKILLLHITIRNTSIAAQQLRVSVTTSTIDISCAKMILIIHNNQSIELVVHTVLSLSIAPMSATVLGSMED